MTDREEFEEHFKDYYLSKDKKTDKYVSYHMRLAWEAWQEQQKKIDDLQLKIDIKDDMITAYKLVIDELTKTVAEQDKEIDMLHEKIDIIYKAIVIDDEEEEV